MIRRRTSIKIIVDNRTGCGALEEAGFAALIEADGKSILLDTGLGAALLPNLKQMGHDLRKLDTLVLSHGHMDHCGAVSKLLEINPGVEVYAHSGIFSPRYSIKSGEPPREIAVPENEKKALLALPEGQLHWIERDFSLTESIRITGQIERTHPLEDAGGPFFFDIAGENPDPVDDDISIWITTERGVVIITGCCHSGIINTVNHVRRASGGSAVRGMIGGLHLMNASPERLQATCDALSQWSPEFVIPCHCTGEEAVSFLKNRFGGRMILPGYSGLELNL